MISARQQRAFILVGSIAISSSAQSPSVDLPHPGPAKRAPHEGAESNARCEHCHTDIAREWRSSHHRSSFSNVAFQRSVRREGSQSFCIDCHAPETTRSGAPTPDEAALGVGCITCHVPKRALLAAPHAEPSDAPHALQARADFASAEACRGCHEFRFSEPRPDWASEPAQWMQRTWREHSDGNVDGSSTGCSGCHMPTVDDGSGKAHRRHDFPGGYDADLVRRSLRVTARRSAPGSVEVTLLPGSVTHAVPTGDLFRRLVVSAQTVAPKPTQVVRYLARHHQDVGRGMRVEVSDDRPRQRKSVVTLDLSGEASKWPIRYRIVYQRVDRLVGNDESRAVVVGEIELASGELPPGPLPSSPSH